MPTELDKPPFPRKRNIPIKNRLQKSRSIINQQFKKSNERVPFSSNPQIKSTNLLSHLKSIRQMSAKQNILESREYPINELTDKQKRSKRGLLKQCMSTQPDKSQITSYFKASFNSIESQRSKSKRIIRIRSQRSIQKKLAQPLPKIRVQQRISILKEQNSFYHSVHNETLIRLAQFERKLQETKSQSQKQKIIFQQNIKKLKKQVLSRSSYRSQLKL